MISTSDPIPDLQITLLQNVHNDLASRDPPLRHIDPQPDICVYYLGEPGIDGAKTYLAGLTATTFGSYLRIVLLWTSDALRGQGVGAKMMLIAEDEARRRGCTWSIVDTFSFQAEGFYAKLDYERAAVVLGVFQGRASTIHMTKRLRSVFVG